MLVIDTLSIVGICLALSLAAGVVVLNTQANH